MRPRAWDLKDQTISETTSSQEDVRSITRTGNRLPRNVDRPQRGVAPYPHYARTMGRTASRAEVTPCSTLAVDDCAHISGSCVRRRSPVWLGTNTVLPR